MITVLLVPLATAALCYALRGPRASGLANVAGSLVLAAVSVPAVLGSASAPVRMGVLYMDALSGYMVSIIVFLSLASSLYSMDYLRQELRSGLTDEKGMRRYYLLFHLFVFTMLLVVTTSDLAVMWIGIEATTIVSALLIGLGAYKRELAIEAAWKYLILCTVGITFALLGIFIAYYASMAAGGEGTLDWTALARMAKGLNPATMRLAFIFVLVGYGTKAGLAPVHNWLPDAHSEAPSPISALLSGVLLNTAFYGVLRFVSIVEPSTGSAFTGGLLMVFGMLSLALASLFILVQQHYKRLLAYSSIEHMGIISLGFGIGGPAGLYGALLHVLNHALAKPLMFFVSGSIQARYGMKRIEEISGVLSSWPLLGGIAFIGALALAGTPPFNTFLSELAILRAGADRKLWAVVFLSLLFLAVVFYGLLSSFGRMLLGQAPPEGAEGRGVQRRAYPLLSSAVMLALAAMVVALGIRVPGFVDGAIRSCIVVLGMR